MCHVCAQQTFEKDFESGLVSWWADNGLWDVGTTTAGPNTCHGSSQCAGTLLDGDYSTEADSQPLYQSICCAPGGYG